jgi:hypothetical protein
VLHKTSTSAVHRNAIIEAIRQGRQVAKFGDIV